MQIIPAGGDCMNVILKGKARQVVEDMVDKGYANTKSEAVRQAVLQFGEKMKEEIEIELVNRKLDRIDAEAAQGKRRTINSDQALGEYAKYLKK